METPDHPHEADPVNEKAFWDIIAAACTNYPDDEDEWNGRLLDSLMSLEPDDIVEWNRIYDRLAARAYTIDMWGAAYVINGGASDDGFYYFRCWLICMGRGVYERAVANPDTLADVVVPGLEAELEIYAVAYSAWSEVTGKTYEDPDPIRHDAAELVGENWDFDDDAEVARRLPRLFALYRESDPG